MDKNSKTREEASSFHQENEHKSKWFPGRRRSDGKIDYNRNKLIPRTIIYWEKGFFHPHCIATTPTKDIAVADLRRGVEIYDINGFSKGNIGIKGAQAILATQDRLVVIAKNCHLVNIYKMDGKLDFQFSTEQHDKRKEIKKAGTEQLDDGKEAAGPENARPCSVAVKKDWTIVVGDDARMVLTEHRPEDGKILRTIPVKIKPEYLAIDDDDRILISDRQTVLVLDDNSAETFIKPMIGGQPAESKGLCCTKSAIFLVLSGDGGSKGRIHQYDYRGNFVVCITRGFLLQGITVTSDQQYLAVIEGFRVAIYNAQNGENNVHAEDSSETFIMVPNPNTTRSPKSGHLQLVLDEINKLTENLTASQRLDRRVQSSCISSGYFNEKGGSLSLDEHGVHLDIPSNAIAPGSPQQVYIYVDPTAQPNDAVEPTEVALSQNVDCGPKGLKFVESVVLSFPHHADLKGPKYDKLVVRMCHDDSKGKKRQDDNPALVTEEKVFVLVGHCADCFLVGTPTPGSSKQLKVGAFGGILKMDQYAFRVHVWNDENQVERKVLQEEESMNSKKLDVFRNFVFFRDSGNLAVKLSGLEYGWTNKGATEEVIDEKSIADSTENSVTFNLKRQAVNSKDRELFCVACVDYKNKTEIRLKIHPIQETSTLCELCKGSMPKNSTNGCRQQEPRVKSPKGISGCTCPQKEGAAELCTYCKEEMGYKLLTLHHGSAPPKAYGGLSQGAVWSLCDHLDGGKNWTKLVERMSDLTGTSVARFVHSDKICTKDVLKFYFRICRDSKKTDEEAIKQLLKVLEELKFEGAVQIIQEDLNELDLNELDLNKSDLK